MTGQAAGCLLVGVARLPFERRRTPFAFAFAALDERLRAEDLQAADLAHHLAVVVEDLPAVTAAEALHRRAGLLLTLHPNETRIHRRRVDWACCLSANLASQRRWRESEHVLLAAVALAEALFGPHDQQTLAARSRLNALWGEAAE